MDAQEPLPSFRYFRDPLADGTFKVEPDTPCLGCNRLRGYIYTGPVTTEKNFILEYHLCPWCIADGTAARRFGALFNSAGTMDDVSQEVMQEIEERTPGFETWQDLSWPVCCNDGAQYLATVGAKELKRDYPDAVAAVNEVLTEDYGLSGAGHKEFFDALSKDDQPSAYIFQCLHCKNYLACVDET